MLLLHSETLAHYGLERVFRYAKEAGYDGVEISITRNRDTQDPTYIQELEERYGVPVRAFTILEGLEDELMEVFQNTVKEFPGSHLNLSSPQVLSFGYKKWLEGLVPRLAAKYKLVFCRKNSEFKTFMGLIPQRSENSIYTLKEAGNVCLDLSALAKGNEDVMQAVNLIGKSLKHVYLNNMHRSMPYSLPQNGVVPVESFLTKLAQLSYKGDFSLKVSPTAIHESNPDHMLQSLKEVREFWEKYFESKKEEI